MLIKILNLNHLSLQIQKLDRRKMTEKRNPNDFTIKELKEKLSKLGLTISGSKADLIARLDDADPTGNWMLCEEEIIDNTEVNGERNVLLKEIEILRREKDLAEREGALRQRQLNILRNGNERVNEQNVKVNITEIKELINTFDGTEGTYNIWEKKIRFLLIVQLIHELQLPYSHKMKCNKMLYNVLVSIIKKKL